MSIFNKHHPFYLTVTGEEEKKLSNPSGVEFDFAERYFFKPNDPQNFPSTVVSADELEIIEKMVRRDTLIEDILSVLGFFGNLLLVIIGGAAGAFIVHLIIS